MQRSSRSPSARAASPAAKPRRAAPSRAPVPAELGEGLRAIADPELRACLESLAGIARRIQRRPRLRHAITSPFPSSGASSVTTTRSCCGSPRAAFSLTACNADKAATNGAAHGTDGPVDAGRPPPMAATGRPSSAETPEGGFVMGNPNAQVKLVEFGSMTCPHCASSTRRAMQPLIDNYVKSGLVSFEFRNYRPRSLRHDRLAVARCGGPSELLRPDPPASTPTSPNGSPRSQTADPAQMQALRAASARPAVGRSRQARRLPAIAAMRGVPSAKPMPAWPIRPTPTKLVQMQSDATSTYPNVPGTPSLPDQRQAGRDQAGLARLEPGRAAAQGAIGS